jgi:hypothetical protein
VQQFVIYLFLGLLFLAASSLVLFGLVAMQTEQQHGWIPASTRHCILASTVCYIHFLLNKRVKINELACWKTVSTAILWIQILV